MPSYEQRSTGWSVRFRAFDGVHEKNMRLSGYKTKKEAQQAYIGFVSDNPLTMTEKKSAAESFDALVAEFLASKQDKLKESSYLDMERRIVGHILPYFRGKRPEDISVAEVEKWQEGLSAQGLAFSYKKNIRNYLQQIFKLAKRRYKIPNVMDEVENFRNLEEKREMQIWTEKDFARFYAAMEDEPIYRAFFHTLYVTGMRRGEALALKRGDLYTEDKQDSASTKQDSESPKLYIRVNKSLTYKTKGATYKVTTTKTKGSNRSILIPRSLFEELITLPRNAFLFGENGNPLSENTVTRKFKKYTKIAGLKEIRVHDLRHSHASFLISHNVPITAISKRLGHSTIEQTLNTYAHMMPSDEEKVARAISTMRV